MRTIELMSGIKPSKIHPHDSLGMQEVCNVDIVRATQLQMPDYELNWPDAIQSIF